MKTAASHLRAAQYYAAIGMRATAQKELRKAASAQEREQATPAPYIPTKREKAAMRAAYAQFRYGVA